MAVALKDNGGTGTPLLVLPTGEQQIVVSNCFVFKLISFLLFIKVACRIRPMTEEEILQGGTIIAHKVAEDNVYITFFYRIKRIKVLFLFDRWLFYLTQKKIMMIFYVKIVLENVNICLMWYPMLVLDNMMSMLQQLKTLLSSVLEGYNATVFAYGATGKEIKI